MWFEPNVVAIASSASTPIRGDRITFMSLVRNARNGGFSLILAIAAPALACEVPDDGSAPLRGTITRVKHLPETGETFRHDGWSFEIVDMDGRKIDKLIASRPRKRPARVEAEAVG